MLSHGALSEHVHHVEDLLLGALPDLLRQEQRRVDGPLGVDVPPAHVVCEGEEHGAVRAG